MASVVTTTLDTDFITMVEAVGIQTTTLSLHWWHRWVTSTIFTTMVKAEGHKPHRSITLSLSTTKLSSSILIELYVTTSWLFLSLLTAELPCICRMSCRREQTRFGFKLGGSFEHGNDTLFCVRDRRYLK